MLYRLFCNYDYRLNNSFVYSWESDFFAVSGSGYCVEVEVKVSRGDFFRDFEKDKHQLFKAHLEKKKFYITSYPDHGDEIVRFRMGKLVGVEDYTDMRNRWWKVEHNGKRGFWVNDNDYAQIRWNYETLGAPATRINFHQVADRRCPNQLYFACPKDLIKLEDIPAYAGLIYCDTEAEIIRRAPYLHKVKQDMKTVLLSKFYNLWQYKTDLQQKIEITRQYNLFCQSLNDPSCRANLL
jgi:hypothetical protein